MPDGATSKVVPMFGGEDPRLSILADAVMTTVYERGAGLPFAVVLGALRLVEHDLVRNMREST